MKNIKRIAVATIAVVVSMTLIIPTTIQAAGFSVYASTGSVTVGSSFTVSVGGSVTGRFDLAVSNGTLLTTSVWVEDNTQSVTVTPSGAGTTTVTVTATDVSDSSTFEPVTGSQSVSVSVVANNSGGSSGGNSGGSSGGSSGGNSGGATDNNQTAEDPTKEEEETVNVDLASLSVSSGELSPAFAAGTTNYTVELTNDIKELTVEATAADAAASVSGTGKKELKEGENKIEVTVTSKEQSKVYTINAYVEKTPEVYLNLGSNKLGILTLKSAPKLEGFEEYKLTIDGSEVTAQKKISTGLILLYMVDEKGERNYYIYDEKAKEVTSIYIPTALFGKNYAIITIPEEMQKMEGYKFGKVTVGETELEGWIFENTKFKNYKLVYLMDENDVMKLYQYEEESQTLQPFSGAAPITQEEYESLKSDADMKNILLYSTIGLGVATAGLLVALLLMKKKSITPSRPKINKE